MGPPDYLNPDVVARFDTVRLGPPTAPTGSRVGHDGRAPPATTKVAITALGGARNQFTTVITGLDAEAKVAWFESAVRAAAARIGGIAEVTFERIGTNPPTTRRRKEQASLLVRTTVTGDERAVGRPFGAAIVELAAGEHPRVLRPHPPRPCHTFGTYWPAVIEQSAVPHRVTLPDGTTEADPRPAPTPRIPRPTVFMRLH